MASLCVNVNCDHQTMKSDLMQSSTNVKLPLSPISFLQQAAVLHGSAVSLVYGQTQFTWAETHQRCTKLASSLTRLKISPGDIVVALAPNIPALYELHFAVPMAGAALSALNTRLDAATLALVLQQLEPKVIVVDYQSSQLLANALDMINQNPCKSARIVLIQETGAESYSNGFSEHLAYDLYYDELVETGLSEFEAVYPINEGDMISVNYTSGSTGFPKGVIYSHRAAYLNSLAQIGRLNMKGKPVFLWTVDMFRCNGWCFTWAMAALQGTNICLRNVSAKSINEAIVTHHVTHLCGAPSLLNLLVEEGEGPSSFRLRYKVHLVIAGRSPPRQVLERVGKMGFIVTNGYGMTEALGPVIYKPITMEYKIEVRNRKLNITCPPSRTIISLIIDVKDPKSMQSVPKDGKTIGEVMLKGDTLMTGYFKNPNATWKAFKDGWFRTGDMGVRAPDGSVVMLDRMKDAIFCGNQIISSIDIEEVLISHPMVSDAAVVGGLCECSEQRPFAFVKLKTGCAASAEDIVTFCVERLPDNMVPRAVFFGNLPLNSTGKVQKFLLRKKLESCPVQQHPASRHPSCLKYQTSFSI